MESKNINNWKIYVLNRMIKTAEMFPAESELEEYFGWYVGKQVIDYFIEQGFKVTYDFKFTKIYFKQEKLLWLKETKKLLQIGDDFV